MTKVAVFVPTHRVGGLDVLKASLDRQTVKPDVVIVSDRWADNRRLYWLQLAEDHNIQLLHPDPIKPGNKRDLCREYNRAARLSVTLEADLFISLQDYIWIPGNGIERFVKTHEENPNNLITGITHISKDPGLPKSLRGNESFWYTIFETPFVDKPKKIDWFDVRSEMYATAVDDIVEAEPGHWEANWAAVPVDKFRQGIFWDEEYDKGIAYENMDFAQQCVQKTQCRILIDRRNEAVSLPHKKYFQGEEEEIIKYSNRWLYEGRWE